jgi:predicted O-methyltransferase YrrM
MYQPIDVASSYKQNDIGHTLYNTIVKYKPKNIIDFGILNGYSTIAMAQAVRDIKVGHIFGLDLFEKYPYNKSTFSNTLSNLHKYNIAEYVTLSYCDFTEWIEKSDQDFDLLHLDISNDGDILERIYNKYIGTSKIILFEGGSLERDEVDWMVKYNRKKISTANISYSIIDNKFPSLSQLIL